MRRFVAEESGATGLPLAALLLAAALLHVLVTLRAGNPWHPDEHFQILEFAWARAGLAPLGELPWEFAARIRPTLQPTLAMGALAALRAVGVTSPWPWILALRLATLALSFAVLLHVIAHASPTLGRAGRRTLWLAGLFLWFAPLFTSRFTSENLSGLALAAALPWLERDLRPGGDAWPRRDLGIGALLGLAFVLRFQMAFAIAAVLVGVVVRGAGGLARVGRLAAGALAVVALGALLDAWFYGAWVFTPWEYLRTNLIEGMAATFGTSPWWWYFAQAPLWMAPPLGIALAGLLIAAIVARPRSPWVWAFVAFLAGHSLIAHKELRFLFPLLPLLPVLLALGVDAVDAGTRPLRWRRPLVWALVAQNTVLAFILLTPSIHQGREMDFRYYRFLWDAAETRAGAPLFVLSDGGDPYRVEELVVNVVRHPAVRGVSFGAADGLAALLPADTPPGDVLVTTRDGGPPRKADVFGWELLYVAEPGYRIMARSVGLDGSALERKLKTLEGWTRSEWVRRAYRPVDPQ